MYRANFALGCGEGYFKHELASNKLGEHRREHKSVACIDEESHDAKEYHRQPHALMLKLAVSSKTFCPTYSYSYCTYTGNSYRTNAEGYPGMENRPRARSL